MPEMTQYTSRPQTSLTLPAEYHEPRWYAAYTRARHEKRIAEQLDLRQLEFFLPLYEKLSRWQDRRVRLELPLFPGYIFVRLALKERLAVLQVPGVVRLVGFGGLPAPLPEGQVETLRQALTEQLHAEPHPFLASGRRVRVRHGPLAGYEGILVRRKGNYRVVLAVDMILRSIIVDIEATDLEPI
jgi:transcription elongation factor/antiterminator RfaH